MGGRGAVLLAVAWWAGLALGAGCPSELGVGAAVIACALLVPPRAFLLPVVFLCAGVARMAVADAQLDATLARLPPLPVTTRLSGVVDEPPRREGDAPAAVVRILAASPAWPKEARVALRLPAGCMAEQGDTVEVLARLEAWPGLRVPGGYDAQRAARVGGRVATGRAFTVRVRPCRGVTHGYARVLMRFRRAAEDAMRRGLSREARTLAAPLLFGDRGGMDTDTDAVLRASGLVHLLALSGLHVAWLAAVARGFAALIGLGLRGRAAVGAASAWAYAGLAGPIPSLARAVAGESLNALACATGRALDPVQSLAIAVIALLAVRPAWGGDLGFQLSCAATLGLVVVGTSLQDTVRASASRAPLGDTLHVRAWRLVRRGAHALMLAVAPTVGAQIVALPLLLVRFHALPWTSLLANLVAVPIAELLLAAAGLGAILEVALPGAGHVAFAACEPLARALHAIMFRLGGGPWALVSTGHGLWPLALALLTAAAACAGMMRRAPRAPGARPSRARALVARVAWVGALMTVFSIALVRPLRPPRGCWWLVAIDVGQGDALAIAGPDGWWLVDTGPRSQRWDAGDGAVLPFLRWAGVRRLEALVLTHDDGDHTGGATAVLRGLPVRVTVAPGPRPGVPGPGAHFVATSLVRGDSLRLAPGERVCWPPVAGAPGEGLARRGDNAAALVLELGTGEARALLTADADSLVERELDVSPGIEVLKAGHHGSGSSSGACFVRRIAPRIAILSCGVHNPYGHPEARACERLRAAGARLDRTDREGTLWYEFSSSGVRRLDWRSGATWRPARAP